MLGSLHFISLEAQDEGCFVFLHSHKPVNDQNMQNVQMPGHLTKSDNQSFWNTWIQIHHCQRIVGTNMRWETEYVKLRRSDSLLCEVCDAQLNQVANVDTAYLERAVWFKLFCSLSRSFFLGKTSSTATLFWTSWGKLGGHGLGVELVEDEVEEVEEEVSLPDLGRERARNLTTDLLQYLQK